MTCAASKDDFSVTIRNGTILIWRQMWVNVQTVQETDAPRVMSRFLNLGAANIG